MSGKLTVVCGPMFSGKTEELIRRVRRAYHAEIGVQIFTPSTDTRRAGQLVSHAGTDLQHQKVPFAPAIIGPDEPFAYRVRSNVNLVVLDEAQFFSKIVVLEVLALLRRNVSVFAAGLDRDFRGRPFGPVPFLLAHADEVVKLTAVCASCKTLDSGTMTHRLSDGDAQIQIGGVADYQPLCRSCWDLATS